MKKLLAGLSLIVLLAGCASRDNSNGTGGTTDQYNNNAIQGTSTTTGTNDVTKDNTGQPMAPNTPQQQ